MLLSWMIFGLIVGFFAMLLKFNVVAIACFCVAFGSFVLAVGNSAFSWIFGRRSRHSV